MTVFAKGISTIGLGKKTVGLVEYGKPFFDLKTPLEVLEAIYDLLEGESEFDMLVFLLILLGRTATRLLYFKRNILPAAEIYYIWRKIPLLPRH